MSRVIVFFFMYDTYFAAARGHVILHSLRLTDRKLRFGRNLKSAVPNGANSALKVVCILALEVFTPRSREVLFTASKLKSLGEHTYDIVIVIAPQFPVWDIADNAIAVSQVLTWQF